MVNICYILKCKHEAVVIYPTLRCVKKVAGCQCFITSSTGSHVQWLSNHFVLVTYNSTGCSVSKLHCVKKSVWFIRCGVFVQQEISRHLRPTTLRALYGKDKVKNAVHCTDLPDDGVLEVGAMSLTHTHIVPSMCRRVHPHDFLCVAPLILQIGFLIVFQSMHK